MGLLNFFFPPKLELSTNIGRLLASQQYTECARFITDAPPKKLSKELNYIIAHARRPEAGAMHRYKFVNELYELIFGRKSKYYNEKFFQKCVDAESTEDKEKDFYTRKLEEIFKQMTK
jgi:hypothetical protein